MLIVILGCHEIVKNVYIYKAERWNIIDMDINFGFNQSFSKTYICRFNNSENTWICARRVLFLSLFFCIFDDQLLSQNVDEFVILCICWDTPSENTSLWQLPKVSSAFKHVTFILENLFVSLPMNIVVSLQCVMI